MPPVRLERLLADAVRCFGWGRRLILRLADALGGRLWRRALGLSSIETSASSSIESSSASAVTRRDDADVRLPGVEDPGAVPKADVLRAGVEGDCMVLADGRFDEG